MAKYHVSIIANIVRTSFEIEADNEEEAENKAFELWGNTTINEMTRVDVSDTDIFELKS